MFNLSFDINLLAKWRTYTYTWRNCVFYTSFISIIHTHAHTVLWVPLFEKIFDYLMRWLYSRYAAGFNSYRLMLFGLFFNLYLITAVKTKYNEISAQTHHINKFNFWGRKAYGISYMSALFCTSCSSSFDCVWRHIRKSVKFSS